MGPCLPIVAEELRREEGLVSASDRVTSYYLTRLYQASGRSSSYVYGLTVLSVHVKCDNGFPNLFHLFRRVSCRLESRHLGNLIVK